jgi:DNA-binding GntR family transcriptional regulator
MNPDLFTKIAPRTYENEILNNLRGAIISGSLPPGAHLTEGDLAAQMDVSRIPIRETLRKLEQEGLVVRYPNRGCFVINFTEQDVEEVFSLRACLESMALQWAIPKLTPEDIAHLRQLIERQENAVQQGDTVALAQLDLRFHEFLCAKANHSRLLKTWYEQHAQCQILLNLRFRTLPEDTPDTVLEDHTRLLAAIVQKDIQTAIALTDEISRRVSRECKETLRQMKG